MCRQRSDTCAGSILANQRASAADENNRTGETPVKSMFDRRTKNARDITELLEENYGTMLNVFVNKIPLSVRAAETTAKGVSIFQYDPNGTVGQAYEALTKEVLEDESRNSEGD